MPFTWCFALGTKKYDFQTSCISAAQKLAADDISSTASPDCIESANALVGPTPFHFFLCVCMEEDLGRWL